MNASRSSRAFYATTAMLVLFGLGAGIARGEPKADVTVMVPMADGTLLATDVYLPERGGPAWPVRLVRTPYGRRAYAQEYGRLAEQDYVMVLQDMRGRFESQGKDLAFLDCGWAGQPDGLETVRWIHAQPWCNGKVGTEGASAMGITQCLMAPVVGDLVSAQYIAVAAPSLYHHASYVGGAWRTSLMVGWLNDGNFDPENFWLVALHPFYDTYWRGLDSIRRAPDIDIPAVHYGGWYDVFLQGTIDAFVSRNNRGGPHARGSQKLIIGPWGHGGPKARPLGEVLFPENNLKLPIPCGSAEWFDHYLKGADNGIERIPAVQYYTMGALEEKDAPGNEWRSADNWPVPAADTPYYFQADGSMSAARPRADEGAVEYVYDPRDPVPTRGGCLLLLKSGVYDQRELEARPDVVTFTTAPLAAPLEVTGRLTARIELICDRVDTDLAVKLTDVYPDGRSYNIADGLARCRLREGLDRLAPLTPGEPATVDVDLWSTSHVFNRGHRIRVAVTGSNYPRFDANPNTGWPAWPMCPMQPARHRILCNGDRASQIILPVVER